MQPRPTEFPQKEPADNPSSQSTSSAQHGLQNDLQPCPSPSLRREAGEGFPQQGHDADAVSVCSGGSERGRKANVRRLNSNDRSSQGSSPGNRIDDYERSHRSSPRSGGGLSFQVIPSLKNAKERSSVDQFPNGKLI